MAGEGQRDLADVRYRIRSTTLLLSKVAWWQPSHYVGYLSCHNDCGDDDCGSLVVAYSH
jgi:hypothetical protein